MLDITDVVSKLNSADLIRVNRPIGNYISIYCPFHNEGKERKASCGILQHDEYKNGVEYKAGWTHCFTCGYAKDLPEMIGDLLALHNINQTGEEWLKEHVPGYDPESDFESLVSADILDQITSELALDSIKKMTHDEVKYVSEEELASYRYTVDYMYERKLTDAVISKYDIGVDLNWVPPGRKRPVPCITFPVRDNTLQTLFLCRRSIEGKLFHYPSGAYKPVYGLYELDKDVNSLVICESCINALTAIVYGYPAVALLGTGTPYQIQQLKQSGIKEFVICTDGDEAGRRSAKKLKSALKSVGIVWTVNMPDGKDLNDLTKEEFESLYKERE